MKNCLKSLAIVAVFVAASFVGVKGSAAATGNVSVPMPGLGTVNVNMAGGSNFAVASSPSINTSGTSFTEQEYAAAWLNVGSSNPAIYTVFCWKVQVEVTNTAIPINNSADWKCGVMNTLSAPGSVDGLSSLAVTGTLGITSPNACSWLMPYDPATQSCGVWLPNPSAMGNASTVGSDIIPNLDPFVGQSLHFDVVTNWCSYLAPPGLTPDQFMAALPNQNVGLGSPRDLGCDTADPGFTLSAVANNAARSLAASPTVTREVAVTKTVGATVGYDCIVPKVKGLTLRKAKARLHRANCGSTVRYVRGARAGRVRYQPLAVGTGKPRGYKVKLAVAR